MYLASFSNSTQDWKQGGVRLAVSRVAGALDGQAWWSCLKGLVELGSSLREMAPSMRVRCETRTLTVTHLWSTSPSREADLRRFLAGYARLERYVRDSIVLPSNSDQFDQITGPLPRWCSPVLPQRFVHADTWLALDVRVHPFLDELMRGAVQLGHDLTYHCNVEPAEADPEQLRRVLKNAARARSLPGIPAELARHQAAVVDRLRGGRLMCEEFLAADDEEALQWAMRFVEERHDRRHWIPGLSLGLSAVPGEDWQGSLVACRHRTFFGPLEDDEACVATLDEAEIPRILGWKPERLLLQMLDDPEPAVAAESEAKPIMPAVVESLPPACDGNGRFVFISYKREDLGRIAPLLSSLQSLAVPFWYDRGIPGGSEWDAQIEEHIDGCRALLLCASQAALESRYVRREVKFADALGKPILTVCLEPLDPRHGMRMLLQQYQSLDASVRDFSRQLDAAMGFLRMT